MNIYFPERKRIRLSEYDYSSEGDYFVTICTKGRKEFFGEIRNGIMGLNEFGCIAAKCWQEIPKYFCNVKLGTWQIMPNHVHGVLNIEIPPNAERRIDRTKMLLPKIIHGFKSAVTRQINGIQNKIFFQWQRSYYDHIIRDEKSLNNICEYIQNNPYKWSSDVENRKNRYFDIEIKNHYDHLFNKHSI